MGIGIGICQVRHAQATELQRRCPSKPCVAASAALVPKPPGWTALLADEVAGTEIRTAPRRHERRPVIHGVINPAPVRPGHLTGRFPREGDMPGVVPSSAADEWTISRERGVFAEASRRTTGMSVRDPWRMTTWQSLPYCAAADVTLERIRKLVAVRGTEPLTVDFKEGGSTAAVAEWPNHTTWHARPAGTPMATIDASSPEELVAAIAEQEATLGTSPNAHG